MLHTQHISWWVGDHRPNTGTGYVTNDASLPLTLGCTWLLPGPTSLQDYWKGSWVGPEFCRWHQGRLSHPEGGVSGAGPGTEPHMRLGLCCGNHGWVHPGAGCPMCTWCVCGAGVPCTATRSGRGTAMEAPGAISVILPYCRQWPGGTGTILKTWRRDSTAGESLMSGKSPGGTYLGDTHPRRTLYSQDLSPSLAGGTCQIPECYPSRLGITTRITSGTWWIRHVGDPTWCTGTPDA
jgi:hypothetical protein